VVVGNLLISLLRHSDRVHVACQAQLVNVIAPIRSEPGGPAWRQTIFHPFALTSRLAKGDVLQVRVASPTQETGRFGEVPVVDAVATHDAGSTALFVVNRHRTESVSLEVPVGEVGVHEAWTLSDEDTSATNTAEHPDRVVPQRIAPEVAGGVLRLTLPPVSWSAVQVG
jgi:alpha-N-arabinofuranosidase